MNRLTFIIVALFSTLALVAQSFCTTADDIMRNYRQASKEVCAYRYEADIRDGRICTLFVFNTKTCKPKMKKAYQYDEQQRLICKVTSYWKNKDYHPAYRQLFEYEKECTTFDYQRWNPNISNFQPCERYVYDQSTGTVTHYQWDVCRKAFRLKESFEIQK